MAYRHQRKKTGWKAERVVVLTHGTDGASGALGNLGSSEARGCKADTANRSRVEGNQIDMLPTDGSGKVDGMSDHMATRGR